MIHAGHSVSDAAENFYAGALGRIYKLVLLFGVIGVTLAWLLYGAAAAAGFALGSVISYVNFLFLAKAVEGLSARVVNAHSREKGTGVVVRFVLRYVLIGIGACVIFAGWSAALPGLLCGLCVPVAAMMAEAVVEAYVAFQRGL